jgi:phosphoglucosamine mutase
MSKYFGTDGFRGEAGISLTADHAYKVGRFLGWYYNALRERNGDTEPARIVIGKDTRRSSYMFEYSLVAGLTASGADAYLLHVTTTPSVAYIARVDDFDCGIMISASHNPYYDNGIKLIDCYGEKMPEETLLLVEDYIDGKLHVFDKDWPELPFAHREHIGCTVDYVAGRNRYMGYLISRWASTPLRVSRSVWIAPMVAPGISQSPCSMRLAQIPMSSIIIRMV